MRLALYGNISLPRGRCPACRRTVLIVNGHLACCDAPVSAVEILKSQRMSHPAEQRVPISRAEAKRILEEQSNSCLYCQRAFGSKFLRRGQMVRLRLEWDHMVPWCHSMNNRASNYAAACHVCNQTKGDKCFATVDEVSAWVERKWAQIENEADRNLRGLRKEVRRITFGASLLRV